MLGLMIFSFVIFTFLLESISLVGIIFGFSKESQGKISDKNDFKTNQLTSTNGLEW